MGDEVAHRVVGDREVRVEKALAAGPHRRALRVGGRLQRREQPRLSPPPGQVQLDGPHRAGKLARAERLAEHSDVVVVEPVEPLCNLIPSSRVGLGGVYSVPEGFQQRVAIDVPLQGARGRPRGRDGRVNDRVSRDAGGGSRQQHAHGPIADPKAGEIRCVSGPDVSDDIAVRLGARFGIRIAHPQHLGNHPKRLSTAAR